MKKVIDVLIILILICSNLFIGTPIKYNMELPNLIINIVAIIFYIYRIIKRKEVKFNRFDVFVILLSISTLIPIIFGSYLRLRFSIEYVLKYFTALNVYLIIKQYIELDKSKLNIIMNCIIILSIVMVVFGIDRMTTNVFDNIYSFLKVPTTDDASDKRMVSLFEYPNTMCVYSGIALFLTLGRYLSKNEYKYNNLINSLYASSIFTNLFAIFCTYSRLGWICVFLLLIMYLIFLKNRWKEIIEILFFSGLNAFICFCIFNKVLNDGKFFIIWICFFIQFIIQCVFLLNYKYFKKLFTKIRKKVFVLVLIIISIVLITCLIVYINTPNDLVLFNSTSSQKIYRKQNIKVEPNKEYTFKLDFCSETDIKRNFRFGVKEWDNQEKLIKENNFNLDNNMDGQIEFSITTNANTKLISIQFKCTKPNENSKLLVRSVKMNEKDIKIHYKLLPIELVDRIGKLTLSTASVDTRLEYLKQGATLIKLSPLFGLGGYAWGCFDFQNLGLKTMAEHCYPLQLFIQNGVFSIWVYIYILFLIIGIGIKLFKTKEKNVNHISFYIALLLILFHSLFDFNMYFQIILLDMYICFAVINIDDAQIFKYKKIIYSLYSVLLLIVLYFSIGEVVSANINIDKNIDIYTSLESLDEYISIFPYDAKYYEQKMYLLNDVKDAGKKLKGRNIEKEFNECYVFLKEKERMIVSQERYDEFITQ